MSYRIEGGETGSQKVALGIIKIIPKQIRTLDPLNLSNPNTVNGKTVSPPNILAEQLEMVKRFHEAR